MRLEAIQALADLAGDNLTEISPTQRELVHGLIYTGNVYVLSGPVSSGKSNIARHLAYSVANSLAFLGFRTHKAPVVFINGELSDDNVAELDAKTPEGTELVVFDYPGVVINHGVFGGSLIEFAKRRNLAVFATTRHPGPGLTFDRDTVRWHLSLLDAEGGSYGHGRIQIRDGRGFLRAIPIVRGNDGDWTMDVHRVLHAFGNLDFHRKAATVWSAGYMLIGPTTTK